jgi:hypothetical protein
MIALLYDSAQGVGCHGSRRTMAATNRHKHRIVVGRGEEQNSCRKQDSFFAVVAYKLLGIMSENRR